MLEIGINEHLRLDTGAKINDKGSLSVKFVKGKAFASALDMMEANADEIPDDVSLLLFLPKVKDKDKKKKNYMDVAKEIRKNYRYISTIVGLYLTTEEINKDFPVTGIYKDLTITKENEEAMFTSEPVIKTMFVNLCSMLNECVKKHKLSEAEPMRLKMKRQSDEKAYASLPYSPEKEVWVELMSSKPHKVHFTDWEKEHGFDNAEITTDITEGTADGNVEDDVTDYEEQDFS